MDRMKEFAKILAQYAKMISALNSVMTLVNDGWSSASTTEASASSALLEALETEAKLRAQIAQALVDASTADTLEYAKLDYLRKHPIPKDKYACKKLLAQQGPLTAEQFMQEVLDQAAEALRGMYRGPYDDGSGPHYAANEERNRCNIKVCNPLDGYEAKCTDTKTVVGSVKRSLTDSDLSPFAMDGSIVLEMPRMKTKEIEVAKGIKENIVVPDPQTPEQKMWVGALNYCFQLAGPRPTPPTGKAMVTIEGLRQRALFNQNLSIQGGTTLPCLSLLAYHTRPTSDSVSHKAIREDENSRCLGARNNMSDWEVKNKFDNCTKGLSYYQIDYIKHIMCKSLQNYLAQSRASAIYSTMSPSVTACSAAWNSWQVKLSMIQGSLGGAAAATLETEEMWKDIHKETPKTVKTRLEKEAPSQPPTVHETSVREPLNRKPLLKGRPLSADEIALPEVMEP